MRRTLVKCIDNGKEVGADILEQSDKRLKVALDGTKMAITLSKRTSSDRIYIGSIHGLEFSSTGN